MKVNVLMPIYGTPLDQVKQAFQSLFDQTYDKFHITVVDDNNPKGELVNYLYGPLSDHKCCVSVVRTLENKGIASALNLGLLFCSGDLILRMDSDDVAREEWIEKQVEFFEHHPGAAICGCQIMLFNKEGKVRESHHPSQVTKEDAKNNTKFWLCNHPGIAMRREVLMSLGGYGDIPPQFAEDYALWIKFLNAGHTIYNLPDVLMDYRVPANNNRQLDRPAELIQDRESDEWLKFLQDQKQLLYAD
jgi:glycosyltransferase involved in cell wall biosynthesis